MALSRTQWLTKVSNLHFQPKHLSLQVLELDKLEGYLEVLFALGKRRREG